MTIKKELKKAKTIVFPELSLEELICGDPLMGPRGGGGSGGGGSWFALMGIGEDKGKKRGRGKVGPDTG